MPRRGLREGDPAVDPRHVYAEMESESNERLAMFSRLTYALLLHFLFSHEKYYRETFLMSKLSPFTTIKQSKQH